MKYYITADIHGFYTEFHKALDEAGYFNDPEPHKLIILGDIFDRGQEALKMQEYILRLMEQDAVILIRGNHEDLYEELVNEDEGLPLRHHVSNGTFSTALQLTGYDSAMAYIRNLDFAAAAKETPYYQRIIPATVDFLRPRTMFSCTAGSPASGSAAAATATIPVGGRPDRRAGARRAGTTGWTPSRPAWRRKRFSAAIGTALTVMRNMSAKVQSSGRMQILVRTMAPALSRSMRVQHSVEK